MNAQRPGSGGWAYALHWATIKARVILFGCLALPVVAMGEREWDHVRAQMKRVFPDRDAVELPITHPLFHCCDDEADAQHGVGVVVQKKDGRRKRSGVYFHPATVAAGFQRTFPVREAIREPLRQVQGAGAMPAPYCLQRAGSAVPTEESACTGARMRVTSLPNSVRPQLAVCGRRV